jgi:tetratricopeptide (TPR) repeat protein
MDNCEKAKRTRRSTSVGLTLLWLSVAGAFAASSSEEPSTETVPPPPSTPREFFNAGTEKLQQGKLREAEAFLESALSSQIERLQPAALYNLGHVRFQQGVEELKKGPSAQAASTGGRHALVVADAALHTVDDALAGDDVQKMVAAYFEGHGARKELKAAITAVQRAMETYGTVLRKWQRSSGDFKSAVEMNQSDADAQHNNEEVERSIAKLIDSLHEMEQQSQAMCQKNGELGEKLKKLRGRIPAENMPPGAPGDDEEDDDQPQGPKPGQKEGPTKDGHEMMLSPEQAGWLLDQFKLDSEHRLPMGEGKPGKPSDRNRPTW